MTEEQLELETLGWPAEVGYQHRYGSELASASSTRRTEGMHTPG